VAESKYFLSRKYSFAKQIKTHDDDREQWDQAWSSQRHYFVNTPLKIDVGKTLSGGASSFGMIISTTISEDPPAYSDRV